MSPARPSVSPRRAVRRWLTEEFSRLEHAVAVSAARHQSDRYRKHFTSWQHVCFVLLHGLSGSPSLRETYRSLPDYGLLVCQSGLCAPRDPETPTVSFPQLAASNTTRSASLLADLLPALMHRAHQVRGIPGIPPDLVILDATYLPLSLVRCPWLTYERGVQLQVLYAPATGVPERIVIPPNERDNDYQGLDAAVLTSPSLQQLSGQTVVVDRGYYSTVRFRALCAAGIHVLTRRHPSAHIQIEEACPLERPLALPGTRITVVADQRITLGSPTFRKTPPLRNWRMVTAVVQPTGKAARQGAQLLTYEILTDRWDLPAHLVIACYLFRWQIELFFRWIKRQLGLLRPLGTSRNAVLFSIWLAMLVHLLHVLAAALLGRARPSVTVRSLLASLLLSLSLHPPAPT